MHHLVLGYPVEIQNEGLRNARITRNIFHRRILYHFSCYSLISWITGVTFWTLKKIEIDKKSLLLRWSIWSNHNFCHLQQSCNFWRQNFSLCMVKFSVPSWLYEPTLTNEESKTQLAITSIIPNKGVRIIVFLKKKVCTLYNKANLLEFYFKVYMTPKFMFLFLLVTYV